MMIEEYETLCLVITIPTRNRSDLAIRTFHSVYDQMTDERVFIQVSDNSTNQEDSDRLRDYFLPGRFEGVELIRPPHPLDMTTHWEWALRRAMQVRAATHFAFITDRMLLRPLQLAVISSICRRFPEMLISYTYDRVNDLQSPVVFSPLPRSGRLYSISSSSLLQRTARMSFSSCFPRMLNSVAPRVLLDSLLSRFGSVFSSISPDYCFCFRSLAVTENILYLDKSILLNYAQARSNGAGLSRGQLSKDGEDFFQNLGQVALCHLTPLPDVATVGNAVIHEYIYVQRELQQGLPTVQREPYLRYLQEEVASMVDSPNKQYMSRLIVEQGLPPRRKTLLDSLKAGAMRVILRLLSTRFPSQHAALAHATTSRPLVWPLLHRVILRYGRLTVPLTDCSLSKERISRG